MSEHRWEEETVDGGPIGDCDFWKCFDCGASGGPVFGKRFPAFLAGHGLKLSEDCGEAKSQVAEYLASEEYRKKMFDWQLGEACGALASLDSSHKVGGTVNRKAGRVNGRLGHYRFLAETKAPDEWLRVTLTRHGVKEVVDVARWELEDLLRKFFDEPEAAGPRP